MYFVGTKGMATLALLLTLPVAAVDNTKDVEPDSASIHPAGAKVTVVEAWATVTDVYLRPAPGDDEEVGAPAYLLQGGAVSQPLLSLENQVAGMLQTATLPAGRYNQLRIVMTEGCLRTDGGTVYATEGYKQCGPADGVLHMPSYASSGLKILLNEIEISDAGAALSLDFDLSQALGRATGKSWTMQPVIQGAGVNLMVGLGATLSPGSVSLPSSVDLADFSATLLPTAGDSSRVGFSDADSDGVYEVTFESRYPDDGPFDVRLNSPEDVSITVSPSSPATVSPAAGETAIVDWELQSVTVDDGGVECPWWVCGF